jgi:hypothetical protein
MIPKFLRPERVPFVDVEIVPTPDRTPDVSYSVDVAIVPTSADVHGPVVDVALVPTKKSRVQQLATLAEIQAVPHADAKRYTKLERAIANKAARLLDAKQLRAWATAVKNRDEWKDRKTGAAVRSTRQLDPLRAEAHHIVSKDDRAVRYDVRNGICLSFATHYAVEKNQLRIEGTAFFVKHGQRYIDGTHPVFFVRL